MANLTTYAENALLNKLLRNTDFTQPVTVYLALFTTATDPTGAGTEVAGFGYARQPITFNAPAGGVVAQAADIVFPQAAGGDWGVIGWAALMSAVTGGNMLYQGPLATARTILNGDQAKFAAAVLTAALS
jgi:hypothetical protein